MRYSIYSTVDGQILRAVITDNIESQLAQNEDYIEGNYPDNEYYIAQGQPTQMPAKPEGAYYFDYSTKQWVQDQPAQETAVRIQRNQLLQQSDWTQLSDISAETKALWEPYRQALRDVTDQPGYPFNIVWPTPPQG